MKSGDCIRKFRAAGLPRSGIARSAAMGAHTTVGARHIMTGGGRCRLASHDLGLGAVILSPYLLEISERYSDVLVTSIPCGWSCMC